MEGFIYTQTGLDKALNKTYEGLLAQGNGYVQLRASFEEGLGEAPQNEEYLRLMKSVTTEVQRSPLSKAGSYIPLIMGRHPSLGEVMLNLPNYLDIRLWADGEPLDMYACRITDFSRSLDLATGELCRSFIWHTASGARLRLCYRRFASMACRHLVVQQVACEALEGSPLLQWESGIDADITTNGRRHFTETALEGSENEVQCRVSTDLGFVVSIHSAHRFSRPVEVGFRADGPLRAHCRWQCRLQPGESHSFCKHTASATSRDEDAAPPARRAALALAEAGGEPYESLLAQSAARWEAMWRQSDVRVKGDEELQEKLRFAIYHLLRCNTGREARTQVCAKGFAGEAYYGRYFWDSEIFLLPFYLYTAPEKARSLLQYRYHTLEGARQNARAHLCRGAKYPWQSGLDGSEQCFLWEYSDNELHITADVAYGLMHYYRATGDEAFMARHGLEMLLETARYWVSRADRDEDGGLHLLNIMGPDEYSPMTRDNAYTNALARFNCAAALEMAEHMRRTAPQDFARVAGKIGFEAEEEEAFRLLAETLPVPYDAKRELVLQSADFEQYDPIDIDALWKDRSKPFGFFAPQDLLYRSRCLKQADVLALMTLFPHRFTDSQVAAAYAYYMPLTVHDSSLSPAGHSLVACRLGMEADVERFLRHTLRVDFAPEGRGAEEGIHIANCGCLWQLVVHGFAGLQPALAAGGEEPAFAPRLPGHIEEIAFSFSWRGRAYSACVSRGGVLCTPRETQGEIM